MDQTAISQNDWMMDDHDDPDVDVRSDWFTGDPPSPYCYYGCAKAHQKWMQEELGDDATGAYSEEYYLQPMIEALPGVLEGKWGNISPRSE